ncbi:MAG: heat-inducible transcriptional repressor HrcA [Actinomycetales bacterium]|nr:heat-inducible transcriptional repressor HrcA [Actinomycetales bacterium]
MISDRSLEVLRAIVNDYIETREPVGSKTLLERHQLGVSSATIRNDMAILEEEELITAPHTSSGRVPTDKGYRLFVDRLNEVKKLNQAERTAIETFMAGSTDLDETLGRTVRLLAQLTNQVAMVQYPTLGRAKVQTVELIPISASRVLLVLVTDTERVQEHIINLGQPVESDFIAELRSRLVAALIGAPLTTVAEKLEGFVAGFASNRVENVQLILDGLLAEVDANRQEKIIMAGAANLVRREQDFAGSIGPVLEAIEEQVILLKLMSEMQAEQYGVGVRIGRENQVEPLSNTTIMVSGYETQGQEIAKLGVLGPTRMDYSSNIAAVSAVARYLSKTLGN